MDIGQKLKTKDVQLVVDLKCKLEWRLPAETPEEVMLRDQSNMILSKISHDLEGTIGLLIMDIVKIRGEKP